MVEWVEKGRKTEESEITAEAKIRKVVDEFQVSLVTYDHLSRTKIFRLGTKMQGSIYGKCGGKEKAESSPSDDGDSLLHAQ